MIATIVALLILILGVPTRFKYYWQGAKVRRRKSARDVSRKFYLVSWIIYVLQVIHNFCRQDWVNVAFWLVGCFTVAYCIAMCYVYWHEKMTFWRWILDSFKGGEEGGLLW
jgi:hypothetical protein